MADAADVDGVALPGLGSSRARLGYRLIGPSWQSTRPPIVLVHGANRRIDVLSEVFASLTERLGVAVLLPHFAKPAFNGYQRLGGVDGRLAAADAMDELLGRLRWHDQPVDLVGLSGGAQFVHRYAMVSRRAIRRVLVAAAGWYTLLDATRPFPFGVGTVSGLGASTLDVDALLALPVHIMIGDRDVATGGKVRSDANVVAQGRNRLERAHHWHDHLMATAARRGVPCRATLEIVPGAGHDVGRAGVREVYVDRVAAFLSADSPLDAVAAPMDGAGTTPTRQPGRPRAGAEQ
jgi:pimeloyl-ACP methyl ester carboxylesterase